MVREQIEPMLAAHGFHRRGRVFWRDDDAVCQVISIAMSRWGSSASSSIDVHLGVFWHRIERALRNPADNRMPPPAHRCTFRISLYHATPKRSRRSWDVTPQTDYAALGNDLGRHLRRYAMRWFAYRS